MPFRCRLDWNMEGLAGESVGKIGGGRIPLRARRGLTPIADPAQEYKEYKLAVQ